MKARTKLELLRNKYLEKTATGNQKKLIDLVKSAVPVAAAASKAGGRGIGILGLLGAAAAVPAAGMATGALQNAYWRKRADQNYDKMIKTFPQLKGYSKGELKENFEVLKTIAPRFSSIPRLAGPWLLRTMEFHEEGLTPSQFRDVMDIEYARRTSLEPTTKPHTGLLTRALTMDEHGEKEASATKEGQQKVKEMYNVGKREIMDAGGNVIGKATRDQHMQYMKQMRRSVPGYKPPKIDPEYAKKIKSFMPSLHKS